MVLPSSLNCLSSSLPRHALIITAPGTAIITGRPSSPNSCPCPCPCGSDGRRLGSGPPSAPNEARRGDTRLPPGPWSIGGESPFMAGRPAGCRIGGSRRGAPRSEGAFCEAELVGRGYGWWCELVGRAYLSTDDGHAAAGPARLGLALAYEFGVDSERGWPCACPCPGIGKFPSSRSISPIPAQLRRLPAADETSPAEDEDAVVDGRDCGWVESSRPAADDGPGRPGWYRLDGHPRELDMADG